MARRIITLSQEQFCIEQVLTRQLAHEQAINTQWSLRQYDWNPAG